MPWFTLASAEEYLFLYNRGGQREETREPPNILINMEEPKCKKKSHIII